MYYYHFDGLGSVVALSHVNRVLVERYTYDVFGRPTIRDANGTEIEDSALGNPYRFTGRAWDAETALYYYRARYYDYATARFLQPDPMGYEESLNLYQYCLNNPIIHVDPTGEGIYKWLYTGDWNASDEVYYEAVDAAADFLFRSSPVRGGYASLGAGQILGGSASISWSMDSGFGVAGRGQLAVPINATSATPVRIGRETGIQWSQENGFGYAGQTGLSYDGATVKVDDNGNLKLGSRLYGPASAGLIIDPWRLDYLMAAWREMLGLDPATEVKK